MVRRCSNIIALLLTVAAVQITARAEPAAPPERAIGLDHVGERKITIDGDLADWGRLLPGGVVLEQGFDQVAGSTDYSRHDVAALRLLHDDEALYVAVRVVDASPVAANLWQGDCVELYLDVRPETPATGPKLGDHAYSDGAYQLLIVPPLNGAKIHYDFGPQKTKPLGQFQVAGKQLADGYSVELRIPFASLNGVTAARCAQPIGVDLQIDDLDQSSGGARRNDYSVYSWGGVGLYQNADSFGRARPGFVSGGPPAFLRALPGRYRQLPNRRVITAGLIAMLDAQPEQATVELAFHKVGSPTMIDTNAVGKLWRGFYRYPALGIATQRSVLDLASIATGSYEIETRFPLWPAAAQHSTFDAVAWHRGAITAPARRLVLPGPLPSGDRATLLPNGWTISPAGRHIALPGDMPLQMAFSADHRYLFVNTGGFNAHGVHTIELAREKVVQSVTVDKTWTGMAYDAGRRVLYLSGAGPGSTYGAVAQLAWQGAGFKQPTALPVPGIPEPQRYVAGLTVSPDGTLYVVNINNDTVYRLTPGSDAAAVAGKVGYRPYTCALSRDGAVLAVSNWGDKSVSLLDAQSLHELARVAVGEHPNNLVYAPDGRLFVACTGSDTVAVIFRGKVIETIRTALDARAPIGAMPVALAVAPGRQRLYVANAGNNDIAVIDISNVHESHVHGFIPTGWYPSALAVSPDGKRLYVGVGKGLKFSANRNGEYIGNLLGGAISVVSLADEKLLPGYTRQVYANLPLPEGSAALQKAQAARRTAIARDAWGKIKHVLYIIRENRSYDQVLGDMRAGNGDPTLVFFGADVTPNAHRLAAHYVLLDNLYCNGEVSQDGHQWCNAAYATDFTEKAWESNYSGRGQPDADERLDGSPAGYLWDNCARHGRTYRSYGEFASFQSNPDTAPIFQGDKGLKGHASVAWSQVKGRDPDRARVFIDELHEAEKTGEWPQFMVMSLGEDHTYGMAPGRFTPVACVASNDQALGQIVDAVTHSRFWKETAIFVIEDDAQNGFDHVDAHRTVGLVISPYVKRGVVDSTFYTTASFVRTMERILGLPPMTQFDQLATPLYNAFTDRPDFAPYANLPPRVNLLARNPAHGPLAQASARLNFAAFDRADPDALNTILWRALKPGKPQPAPVRSARLMR